MGNNSNKQFKDLYKSQQYDIVKVDNERYIGQYKLIALRSNKDQQYLVKLFDPQTFSSNADAEDLTRCINQQASTICNFVMIDINA